MRSVTNKLIVDREEFLSESANKPDAQREETYLRGMIEGLEKAIGRANEIRATLEQEEQERKAADAKRGPFLIAHAGREGFVTVWTGEYWVSVAINRPNHLSVAHEYVTRQLAIQALRRMRAKYRSDSVMFGNAYSRAELTNGDSINVEMMEQRQRSMGQGSDVQAAE